LFKRIAGKSSITLRHGTRRRGGFGKLHEVCLLTLKLCEVLKEGKARDVPKKYINS